MHAFNNIATPAACDEASAVRNAVWDAWVVMSNACSVGLTASAAGRASCIAISSPGDEALSACHVSRDAYLVALDA